MTGPRAAVFIALAAIVCAARPARAQRKAPDPAAIEEARRHMKAGAAFYNDPAGHKCEEALREFTKAYELSGSLNALKGMAICNLELERDGDAIRQYTGYLEGKGGAIEAGEKAQIEADLSALKAAVATVKLASDHPEVKVTDVRTPSRGFPIRNTYALPEGAETTFGLHPGQHVFTASLDGFPDLVWKVELANGGTYAHAFSFHKPDAGPVVVDKPPIMVRPVPASVWVTVGLTGALGIAWGALAVRARLLNSDYQDQNGKKAAAELEDMRSGVVKANVVADVFLGAAVASLGTTAILYLTRPVKPLSPGKAAGIRIIPTAGSRGGALSIGGTF